MIKQDLYGEFRLLSSPRIPQSGPLVRCHGNRLRLVLCQTRVTSLRGEAFGAARSHQANCGCPPTAEQARPFTSAIAGAQRPLSCSGTAIEPWPERVMQDQHGAAQYATSSQRAVISRPEFEGA